MASPGIGAKSYIQWGRESAWGTEANATKRAGLIRHSVRSVMKQEKSTLLTGSYIRSAITNVLESAEGQIELYLTYNDLMMWLDCAMGSATFGSNGGATTGAGPYVHTWTDAKEFYNSLTVELIEGDIPTPGSSKCQLLTGCKVLGFTIRGEAAGFVHVIFDVVAKRMQTNQAITGALTANAPLIAQTAHISAFDDGTADSASDVIVKSFEFTHKNGVEKREACGSAYILEPIRDGVTTCSLKWRKEFRTMTAMDAHLADTAASPAFTLTSSPSILTIQIDTGKFVDYRHGVDGFGIMYQEAEIEGLLTAGSPDQCAKIILTNAQATITT